MKPAPFEYHAASSAEEAIALLVEHGFDAKVLAGGQSLIPTMNFRLAQPAVLVDINGLNELDRIEATDNGVRIGAMTRQRTVERSEIVRERAPLVHEAMPFIAHPQIRNRGTIGGTLAHADPAAELPAVMLAMEATVHMQGPDGSRSLGAEHFFTGLFATALDAGELLTAVEVPAPAPGSGFAFMEAARRHGDYALVGVAAAVRVADGRCEDARVALLSVGDGPVLSDTVRSVLVGEAPTEEAIRDAAEGASRRDIDPPGDIHASEAYRRHLTSVLTRRALTEAFARAESGAHADDGA